MSSNFGNFRPSSNGSGFGTQPGSGKPDGNKGGDVHDTFGVNSQGDVFGGHTTVDLGGGIKTSMPWGSGNNK